MKTLKQLIKKFDWVNPNITEANFPTPKKLRTDYKLFHFNRDISSEDAIKEIQKEGYEPANVYELLSWSGWNENDVVVALGSVAGLGCFRRVLALSRFGDGQDADLDFWGDVWGADCRFLAVRNSESGSVSTSDSLTLGDLESRIKKLEERMDKYNLK